MAKPRVFVSSTYYDLKHIRASLDQFIDSLGFEAILSEKGNIAFTPDSPLDESCFREAAGADLFVLIVGGRYGADASTEKRIPRHTFFERYESITKGEYESALAHEIPVYVLIEGNVYSEYQTYLQNRDSTGIQYAHVDSVNVFRLIEQVFAMPLNNPVHTFERFADIEKWLREQWAGFFRELLQHRSQQQQLAALGVQVQELKAISDTMQTYLEAVLTGTSGEDSSTLIESEQRRLQLNRQISENPFFRYVSFRTGLSLQDFVDVARKVSTISEFVEELRTRDYGDESFPSDLMSILEAHVKAREDFNEVRAALGLQKLELGTAAT